MEETYLTNIPLNAITYGLPKVLAVRREIIHIKHIMTEVFVRKSIEIDKYLSLIDWNLFDYMEYITNRMRRIHHFSRAYTQNPNEVIQRSRKHFFPTLQLLEGFRNCIVLDFDGVITTNRFIDLYHLCIERAPTYVCSANPTISTSWFDKRNMPPPIDIYAMKGKISKLRQLIEIQKRKDYVFYIDNEEEYLRYAWLFGIHTYHWVQGQIKYFTLKTK
jgi:hypothetical protein